VQGGLGEMVGRGTREGAKPLHERVPLQGRKTKLLHSLLSNPPEKKTRQSQKQKKTKAKTKRKPLDTYPSVFNPRVGERGVN